MSASISAWPRRPNDSSPGSTTSDFTTPCWSATTSAGAWHRSPQPERFAGLVLTNAVCYDSWPIPSVKLMARLSGLLQHMPDVAMYPSFVQLLRRGHDHGEIARESIGLHWQSYATHGAAASLMRQVSALDVHDTLAVADRLPHLGLPARVVWGDADQFQKLPYGARLADDLGTDIRRINGGKHFTPEDHPTEIAEAINELVAGTPPGLG